jgi:mannose-6-phosphate isomerase-like protein (cupin superfamily)
MKTRYDSIVPFTTRDGSLIRELMPPSSHGNQHQSLAEAIVAPGCETKLHRHDITEELYFITAGQGLMTLGNQQFNVNVGDTICIVPGTEHKIHNTGKFELKILCCCAPPYSHEDTTLLD